MLGLSAMQLYLNPWGITVQKLTRATQRERSQRRR